MYKAVALTSIAALAGQSMALNAHRHQHQMDKRVLTTDWCTVWTTVYVTVDPASSTTVASASGSASATGVVAQDVPSPTGAGNAGAVPTVTSTSTVLVASSTAAASSSAPAVNDATTMITSARSSTAAPVESSTSSAAPTSSAPASSSSQAASSTLAPSTSSTPTPTPTPTPSSTSQAPPSSTSSKAAASSQPSSPPPAPVGGFPGKRGMAYNDGTLANTFGLTCEKCTWAYNWGFWPSGIDSKYSWVPTLWGPQPEHSNGFDAQAEAALASGSKAIFSFNECDIASQCNLDPASAASSHAQFLNKYSGKALIAAPSISNSNIAGQGLDWLQQWVAACDAQSGGCAYDFCNVHWYSPASATADILSHIESASQICGGKPVLVSEMGPEGSDDEIIAFLKTVLPQLDSNPNVLGYAYFMVGDGYLTSGGALSEIGTVYATI